MRPTLLALAGLELTPTNHIDKIVSGVGGLVAIAVIAWITHALLGPAAVCPVVASMGASAVLLFAAPHGALSQPWPVVMGHLISAIVGITCCRLIANPYLCGGAAVGIAITLMYYARAIHPPGGATALTPVLSRATIGGLGYSYVFVPVMLNAAVLLIVAIVFNYAFRWRRYPAALAPHAKQVVHRIAREDWAHALHAVGTMAPVTEDELVELHTLAIEHARKRSGRKIV